MGTYKVLFTESGFNRFQKEYEDLLSKRPEIVKELTIARDMGDRSENAAYKGARRKLSSTDSRLRFLKKIIEHAQVCKPTQTDSVEIGSIVTVEKDSQKIIFSIVGIHEADPMEKRLSYKSPVGQALMHKKVGDTLTVALPVGDIQYKILKIEL